MKPLEHVMILASAGSGKTYALTNRFVELLAAGALPERIVALTFTRKAAGEFFDEILHKLARAAEDEAEARKLGRDIHRPELTPRDYLALLRHMVDAMHRLKLGTLDSFFSRVARAFPLELGMAGDFEILQEHAAMVERQRVLSRMFTRTKTGLGSTQQEFIEAFKRATFGTEEKQLRVRLDAFLDEHHENFLAAPDAALWGDPHRIWPRGARWFDDGIKLKDAIADLRRALGELTDGQRARWESFFAALEEWSPGAWLADPVEYMLKNTLAAWSDLCDGGAVVVVDRRKLVLGKPACRALEQIVTHLIGAEFKRRIQTTRGIYDVLRHFEGTYHDAVRRMGRLTFSDVQRLLAPDAGAPRLVASSKDQVKSTKGQGTSPRGEVTSTKGQVTSGRSEVTSAKDQGTSDGSDEDERGDQLLLPGTSDLELAAGASASERRLLLDYRLDAEIDHWLLDEFQDTSYGQWSVLRNLIDEVVQDSSGARSFFCVGDVKQAIYAWREGDPRLFREIYQHYNRGAAGAIKERHLVASWRSGPALIEMVNTVFGGAAALAELFPGEATTAWNREWKAHESAVPERVGQAALLHAEDEAARWATTRALLEEIRPLERGLSCAILVKKNDTAAALADFLRHAGIAALAESDLRVATDNPVGSALLSLVQAVAHPGDTLAQEHVRMTPIGEVLNEAGLNTPETLSLWLLQQIHTDGFERTFEYWVQRLESRLPAGDAFSRRRAREFVAAAGLFDGTGSRDLDEFIAFMERHTVRAPETPAVVRVMTIHKSKGLGFDVVILPDLQGNRIDEPREGLAVSKAPDRSVQWILDLPPRLFCEPDDVLSTYVRGAEADACYENLCLLYVAMTRAKRAMYVITEPVGKSKSRNFPRLLADTLGHDARVLNVGSAVFDGVWAAGHPRWHEAIPFAADTQAATVKPRLQPLPAGAAQPVRRRIARRPSATPVGIASAGALFALDSNTAMQFGSAVHALLAEIEWTTPGDARPWSQRWAAAGHARDVVEAAARCVTNPALSSVWQRPNTPAELWRERAFEIVLGDEWVTGVFDRVVVTRDARGAATSAVVYDFKSNRIVDETDLRDAVLRYTEQLHLYRRVAAVLTGLRVTEVRCELVFTDAGRSVVVR